MAFHSQGPNPRESWGESSPAGMALHGVTVSGAERKAPAVILLWRFCAAPVTLYLCSTGEAAWCWWIILLFCFFFLWKSCRFPSLRSVGSLMPSRVTAFPWTQKGKLMMCSGEWLFLGDNSWIWTCCCFLGIIKEEKFIIDQEEKPKQAKFPKPGFYEPPQERGLFSVWFPTRQ